MYRINQRYERCLDTTKCRAAWEITRVTSSCCLGLSTRSLESSSRCDSSGFFVNFRELTANFWYRGVRMRYLASGRRNLQSERRKRVTRINLGVYPFTVSPNPGRNIFVAKRLGRVNLLIINVDRRLRPEEMSLSEWCIQAVDLHRQWSHVSIISDLIALSKRERESCSGSEPEIDWLIDWLIYSCLG